MESVELIVNPKAGQGRMIQQLKSITDRLRQQFRHVDVTVTKQPGDGAKRVWKVGAERDLIIAAGGDGTVYEVVNALAALNQRPRFAILPGGTCNDFSRALGMEQDPLHAVEQILAYNEKQIDVGYSQPGGYFLNFWGIGLITRISDGIDSTEKERLGRLAYYMSAAQHLQVTRPFQLEVKGTEVAFTGPADMLIAGNGSFVGGVRGFFPYSRLDDGMMDVLIIKETSFEGAWSMLLSHLTKEWPESDDFLYFQTPSLKVKASPAQEVDCDGEKGRMTPTELTILPRHLTVLMGERIATTTS
ncbi:diacylglycerol/lipid kinase family protein [Desmospora activa]|uniref:YegS/Rv2252/BmrU family lipid kinase n=1 Tax=Desmospora activa DSM 45169 TaxID=1121389 RepID=A0A2T4ZDG6_9BACL|nr:diacylglycerol kinase family protein [Desmospora activa]PTM59929.1 YegS/Rv2252/BmrU family lipid kinase [Desmospora activa DSM 45169]